VVSEEEQAVGTLDRWVASNVDEQRSYLIGHWYGWPKEPYVELRRYDGGVFKRVALAYAFHADGTLAGMVELAIRRYDDATKGGDE
jgi:hypothetical protein